LSFSSEILPYTRLCISLWDPLSGGKVRFGRLKSAEGYNSHHVFHSIRKTFVTLLENAGISENVTADIVGHEKPRITYGLYSGGTALNLMRESIEKISYESPRKS